MIKVRLENYNNDFYFPGSKFKIILWIIFNRLILNTYFPYPIFFKVLILRLFGAVVGKGVTIKAKVNLKYPWFLEIGDHVWIGENVWIDNLALVKMGSNTCISQGAMILTGNHNYKKSSFDLMVGAIILEDGVWIGSKSIVCPGVTCHSHSVLSVGSVATEDLQSFMIYQGNPARLVRKRIISE